MSKVLETSRFSMLISRFKKSHKFVLVNIEIAKPFYSDIYEGCGRAQNYSKCDHLVYG